MTTTAPYGTWTSPIDARAAARHDGYPKWLRTHEGTDWWCEPRPSESGRVALVRRTAGGVPETVLPAPWNARTRVHEYGGHPYVVLPDGSVVFAEYSDQRLHHLVVGETPVPLTPEPSHPSALRYVEPFLAPTGDEVWCIREQHHGGAPTDVSRAVVAVPMDGSGADSADQVRVVVEDRHFLACPSVSPDGFGLAWIAWEHPSMPWDATELRVADLGADGTASSPRTVAGGPDESVAQACWLDDNTLLAATDRTGWWNLHRVGLPSGEVVNLCPREEEFAGPLWALGLRWFGVLGDGLVATLHGAGPMRLSLLDLATGELSDVATPHAEWAGHLAIADDRVLGVAGGPDRPFQVVEVDTGTLEWTTLSASGEAEGTAGRRDHLPAPVGRTFTSVGGRDVHAQVYPPQNPQYDVPEGERAPYVMFVHGGPTSRAYVVEDLEIAFFTSRGIGVAEVNYGGSSGFGREYRNRLREQWGIVDVEDSIAVAEGLVAAGIADPDRLAIRGLSAGGWTTAAALTSTDAFACGTMSCPILDLAAWQEGGTHDFEAHYLQSLVGPWPEARQRYLDRSPPTNADRLTSPFLLIQGDEDVICPPDQAKQFLERVAGRGIDHAHFVFEGEQHGLRKEESMVAALEAELSLYGQVFGFDPPDVPRLELRQ